MRVFTIPRRVFGVVLLALGAAFVTIGHTIGRVGAWLADVDALWNAREAQRRQVLADFAKRPYTGPHGPTP